MTTRFQLSHTGELYEHPDGYWCRYGDAHQLEMEKSQAEFMLKEQDRLIEGLHQQLEVLARAARLFLQPERGSADPQERVKIKRAARVLLRDYFGD